tara:strand:- start:13596 stop:13832 length:237 start_codon:yes stop_codon:yes gene_type:complete
MTASVFKDCTVACHNDNVTGLCRLSSMESAWLLSLQTLPQEAWMLKESTVLFIMTLQKMVRRTSIVVDELLAVEQVVS